MKVLKENVNYIIVDKQKLLNDLVVNTDKEVTDENGMDVINEDGSTQYETYDLPEDVVVHKNLLVINKQHHYDDIEKEIGLRILTPLENDEDIILCRYKDDITILVEPELSNFVLLDGYNYSDEELNDFSNRFYNQKVPSDWYKSIIVNKAEYLCIPDDGEHRLVSIPNNKTVATFDIYVDQLLYRDVENDRYIVWGDTRENCLLDCPPEKEWYVTDGDEKFHLGKAYIVNCGYHDDRIFITTETHFIHKNVYHRLKYLNDSLKEIAYQNMQWDKEKGYHW